MNSGLQSFTRSTYQVTGSSFSDRKRPKAGPSGCAPAPSYHSALPQKRSPFQEAEPESEEKVDEIGGRSPMAMTLWGDCRRGCADFN